MIDLLVALSLIALATAGAMLASSARAEVQRRLSTIGVERAVGASAGHVTLSHALEAALVSAPAAAIGCAAGVLAIYGPAAHLLSLLNEPAPGLALVGPVLAGWLAGVGDRRRGRGLAGLARRAPARWSACCRAAMSPRAGRRGHRQRAGGLLTLGARLVRARRARLVATVITLGLSTAFVLLLLSLASALSALETDPGALGQALPADRIAARRRSPRGPRDRGRPGGGAPL